MRGVPRKHAEALPEHASAAFLHSVFRGRGRVVFVIRLARRVGVDAPQMDVLVVRGADDVPPARGPRALGAALLVPHERRQARAVGDAPDAHRLVSRRARQPRPVGGKAHRRHALLVPFQGQDVIEREPGGRAARARLRGGRRRRRGPRDVHRHRVAHRVPARGRTETRSAGCARGEGIRETNERGRRLRGRLGLGKCHIERETSPSRRTRPIVRARTYGTRRFITTHTHTHKTRSKQSFTQSRVRRVRRVRRVSRVTRRVRRIRRIRARRPSRRATATREGMLAKKKTIFFETRVETREPNATRAHGGSTRIPPVPTPGSGDAGHDTVTVTAGVVSGVST